jgi:chemotaxis family two-component system response regulator PixG
MKNFGTFIKLRPLSLLRHLSNCSDSTCLQVVSNSVEWYIYLENGKITYGTHSVEPFDRLERHLRSLSRQIPALTTEVRIQLRLMFEPDSQTQLVEERDDSTTELNPSQLPPEYQAICWLVSQRHLNSTQAALLIQEMVKEVIESFLLIKQGIYEFKNPFNRVPPICKLDVERIMSRCQERLNGWETFAPHISSPYQRPYLWIPSRNNLEKLPEILPNLAEWMKGFSLRHLAVILNQDEIQLAYQLYPYIKSGTVLLHEPDPPFDKLPKTYEPLSQSPGYGTQFWDLKPTNNTKTRDKLGIPKGSVANYQRLKEILATPEQKSQEPPTPSNNKTNREPEKAPPAAAAPRKVYKIVTVDDSPTMLQEISHFLDDENFYVVPISDSVKAVMSIIRHKPDLILLDLNMEGLDGYELCRIIRNNSMFKNTPIIMVTASKGLIDKVKARLVGASGYLTKPFTRADLLKIVFMHLT